MSETVAIEIDGFRHALSDYDLDISHTMCGRQPPTAMSVYRIDDKIK